MRLRQSTIAWRRGFSLIELLVSMAIGLVVTLAITTVLIRSEGTKRTTVSVNEVDQTGAYVAYVVDRMVRNAGSGFAYSWSTTYGCLLNASQSGVQVLPPSIPSTSAFAGVTSAAMPIRVAPLIIGKGLAAGSGGDVVMVMAGTGGTSELPIAVIPSSVTASQLQIANTLGYRAGNIVLLADAGVTGGCMLQQIDTTFGSTPQVIPFGGTYFQANGATTNLTSFGGSTLMAQMGVDSTNPPLIQLIGVGSNNTLMSYDLLQQAGAITAEQSIADGVVEMRAIYGVDTGSPFSGQAPVWVDPKKNSGYEADVLLNGSAVSLDRLRRIIAVRLGFILRTSLEEHAAAAASAVLGPEGYTQSATELVLFSDAINASGTSIAQTRTLTAADQHFRFRTVEVTIPLLNIQNAP